MQRNGLNGCESTALGSPRRAAYGQIVATHLRALGVPTWLSSQVVYSFSDEWPPDPCCRASPDGALARLWARVDLAQWLSESPRAFGPHRAGELDILATVGARLREAGEGTRVVWALDVVPESQWVRHDSTAVAVAELVCLGPLLSDWLIEDIDNTLRSVGWWVAGANSQPNEPCIVNRTPCFYTAWNDGITVSDNPAARSSSLTCDPVNEGHL